jgi:hypothetical protein
MSDAATAAGIWAAARLAQVLAAVDQDFGEISALGCDEGTEDEGTEHLSQTGHRDQPAAGRVVAGELALGRRLALARLPGSGAVALVEAEPGRCWVFGLDAGTGRRARAALRAALSGPAAIARSVAADAVRPAPAARSRWHRADRPTRPDRRQRAGSDERWPTRDSVESVAVWDYLFTTLAYQLCRWHADDEVLAPDAPHHFRRRWLVEATDQLIWAAPAHTDPAAFGQRVAAVLRRGLAAADAVEAQQQLLEPVSPQVFRGLLEELAERLMADPIPRITVLPAERGRQAASAPAVADCELPPAGIATALGAGATPTPEGDLLVVELATGQVAALLATAAGSRVHCLSGNPRTLAWDLTNALPGVGPFRPLPPFDLLSQLSEPPGQPGE